MRGLLAVLAWVVMGGAVLGAAFSMVGAAAYMRQHGSPLMTTPGPLAYLLATTGFRLAEAFGIGLGLLFLLDIDRRVRLREALTSEAR